jgi:hypothetical protein
MDKQAANPPILSINLSDSQLQKQSQYVNTVIISNCTSIINSSRDACYCNCMHSAQINTSISDDISSCSNHEQLVHIMELKQQQDSTLTGFDDQWV